MKTETKRMTKRIIMAVIGIFLTSVSVALSKLSGFGVDPFSVLMFGMVNASGFSYQIVFAISCIILAVIAWKLKKSLLGLSTILSLGFTGYLVDTSTQIFQKLIGSPSLALRIVLLIIALGLLSVSAALYYTADLGVSPYDAQALTLADRTPLPFRFCRIGTDIVCVIVGVLLGGDLGIGTVCIAFFMGPAIQFCRDTISEPILRGEFLQISHTNKHGNTLFRNIPGFRMSR